ncbi:hypothetical protein D3C74_402110 [compost metagenome]
MSGPRKSFQYPRNAKIATASSAGFTCGNMIYTNVWKKFDPSISAASSSSRGKVMKNCRSRKI